MTTLLSRHSVGEACHSYKGCYLSCMFARSWLSLLIFTDHFKGTAIFADCCTLSSLPAGKYRLDKYSTELISVMVPSGCCLQGCHGYLFGCAAFGALNSTTLLRHLLPSSSIVDEFNLHLTSLFLNVACACKLILS